MPSNWIFRQKGLYLCRFSNKLECIRNASTPTSSWRIYEIKKIVKENFGLYIICQNDELSNVHFQLSFKATYKDADAHIDVFRSSASSAEETNFPTIDPGLMDSTPKRQKRKCYSERVITQSDYLETSDGNTIHISKTGYKRSNFSDEPIYTESESTSSNAVELPCAPPFIVKKRIVSLNASSSCENEEISLESSTKGINVYLVHFKNIFVMRMYISNDL